MSCVVVTGRLGLTGAHLRRLGSDVGVGRRRGAKYCLCMPLCLYLEIELEIENSIIITVGYLKLAWLAIVACLSVCLIPSIN